MSRVDYRNTFWFPTAPQELWRTAASFEHYPQWWTWLREFDAQGDGLQAGTVLTGTVVPPLPYRLRLTIAIDRSVQDRLVSATVDGDLRGWATVEFAAFKDGTMVTVQWALDFRHPALRLAAKVAYPVVRWGHDRVVDAAVEGFRRNALAER